MGGVGGRTKARNAVRNMEMGAAMRADTSTGMCVCAYCIHTRTKARNAVRNMEMGAAMRADTWYVLCAQHHKRLTARSHHV